MLAGAISLGGVVLVTQSFARACVACKRPLESTSLCVLAEWEGWHCELAQSGHGPALGGARAGARAAARMLRIYPVLLQLARDLQPSLR
ncbi:MAG: hypothetical protein HY908_20575 [Myxococcales bacterium]|nr:hypothetical protein [Myxococcales bacterium]